MDFEPGEDKRGVVMDSHDPAPHNRIDDVPHKRRMEIYAFLIVTALIMPALAVATVGTWGFTVWIYQVISGPPGPPSK